MRRFIGSLMLFLLSLGAFVSAVGGTYYPPRTAVNTVGIKRVPLSECSLRDYTVVYSFEKETDDEWWRRIYRGERIFNRTYVGYLIETRFLGKDYFVYEDIHGWRAKITSTLDRSNTVAEFAPPRYIMGIAAFQHRMKGKDFLVVYIEQQATSHSSTLLIFDENFQIVYQDHLLYAREIGRAGDKIVVKSGNFWYPKDDKRVDINGDWVYFIP